jgi:glycosyltransferase involved in cell wall biosynthesis
LPDYEVVQSSERIVYHGSKTKIEVRDFLLKSDYFVYPLICYNGWVHHDTFGTVILEALACGCIVVVWDVACISSVYEDYVIKIPVPEHAKITGYQRVSNEAEPIQFYNPSARYGSCPWMKSDEAQQLFIDAILELETNQDKKEMIRMRGVEWARKYTWENLGSAMESQLLSHS